MGNAYVNRQKRSERPYPQFIGVAIAPCQWEGSAEVALTPKESVLVSATPINLGRKPHVSLECRHYFDGPHIHSNGFASMRIGSSGRLGLGLGAKCLDESLTLKVGGYMDLSRTPRPQPIRPFIGASLTW